MPIHAAIVHEADPENPGWETWGPIDKELFNGVVGKLIVRAEGPGRARCRIVPGRAQGNIDNFVHGGAILTFVDIALFSGGTLAGADVAYGVTVDCSAQFLSPARLGIPLDAEVELLRETRRLAFLRGTVVQEGQIVAAFSGTLRKAQSRQ